MSKTYEIPATLINKSLPDILLGYQQELLATTALHQIILCEKSRRIGITWGIGPDAVLTSAAAKNSGGMDTLYIGYSYEMTRDFIQVCAMWAKAFHHAAVEIEECVFTEVEDGETKDIKAFRITFDSGFEILALTSKPRSLRGKQGFVIIDEAAFVDDLEELMKAAVALLMWGGKVLIISTHNGVDNYFNELIQDARSGRKPYAVIKIDFDDALRDGLYQRICLVQGKEWTVKGELAWRQEMIDNYGDDANEELFCIPNKSSGAYLSSLLIESCMQEIPVLRYEGKANFMDVPLNEREIIIRQWCEENLKPLLDELDPKLMHFFGEDFGRSGDLTTLWPLQIQQDTKRKTPFAVELRNVPFKQQEQIVFYILDRLPRFLAGAFDARGNGQQLAEAARDRYGSGRIHEVMISPNWYLEAFPKYKAALEDGDVIIPKDADILSDHRAAVMQGGIPRIPEKRATGKDGGQRHGDSLVAAAMAYWATLQAVVEYGYEAVLNGASKQSSLRRDDDVDDDNMHDAIGQRSSNRFGHSKGAY